MKIGYRNWDCGLWKNIEIVLILIEVFKMADGFSVIPLTDMFQIDTAGRTRGHSLKLVKYRCNKDIRKFFSLSSTGVQVEYAE